MSDCGLIVIGASFGGIKALFQLLPQLSKITKRPIIVVQHIQASQRSLLAEHLDSRCSSTVKEASHGDLIKDDFIYIAPGGYHLLVEDNKRLSLSMDERVQYSRPSIDVLFESAADAYDEFMIGIILTGANEDGSEGVKYIHQHGGVCIAQNPVTAAVSTMPQASIDSGGVDYVANLEDIPGIVQGLLKRKALSKGIKHG